MPNKLVSIEPDIGVDSATYGHIYYQCEYYIYVDFVLPEQHRCQADASWLVTQEGELTGIRFAKHFCQKHAQPYINEIEKRKENR